jgi:hypothetical protein
VFEELLQAALHVVLSDDLSATTPERSLLVKRTELRSTSSRQTGRCSRHQDETDMMLGVRRQTPGGTSAAATNDNSGGAVDLQRCRCSTGA